MIPLIIVVIVDVFEVRVGDVSLIMYFCRFYLRATGKDHGIQVRDNVDLKHSRDHLVIRNLVDDGGVPSMCHYKVFCRYSGKKK